MATPLTEEAAHDALNKARFTHHRSLNDLKNTEAGCIGLLYKQIKCKQTDPRRLKSTIKLCDEKCVTLEAKQLVDVLAGRKSLSDRDILDTVYDWFCRLFSERRRR